MQVASRGTFTQNFMEGSYVGMRPGCQTDVCYIYISLSCKEFYQIKGSIWAFYYDILIILIIYSLQTAQTIGFIGDGYVELPSHDLGRSGDLSFSFRTRQEDALLVLAKGTAPQVADTVCVTLCFLISYYYALCGLVFWPLEPNHVFSKSNHFRTVNIIESIDAWVFFS